MTRMMILVRLRHIQIQYKEKNKAFRYDTNIRLKQIEKIQYKRKDIKHIQIIQYKLKY